MVSLLISLLPFNAGKVLLHRVINGYHISLSARIGFGAVLAVDQAIIGKANVLRFNRFEGPFQLTIEDGAAIGPSNRFTCLFGAVKKDSNGKPLYPNRRCRIGANAHITERHYIDTTGGFDIGSGSWIAGYDSQFWTHGPKNAPVAIGNNCYVSSAVRFAPGSAIGDRVVVALGSVVTRKFTEGNVLIGGVPAEIIKRTPKANDPPQSDLRSSDAKSGTMSAPESPGTHDSHSK